MMAGSALKSSITAGVIKNQQCCGTGKTARKDNIMEYTISFVALKTTGEVVGTRSFTITTDQPLDQTKRMSLERFCVEYARLTGLKCSFVDITSVVVGLDLPDNIPGTVIKPLEIPEREIPQDWDI